MRQVETELNTPNKMENHLIDHRLEKHRGFWFLKYCRVKYSGEDSGFGKICLGTRDLGFARVLRDSVLQNLLDAGRQEAGIKAQLPAMN